MSGTIHILEQNKKNILTNTSFYNSPNLPAKHNHVEIIFDGFVPELFQENMGVILDGVFDNDTFLADDMLVKHDNEYVSSDGETYNVENYSE